jgi:prepilin-type N-terminal cleavage/methylation domain-containing protein
LRTREKKNVIYKKQSGFTLLELMVVLVVVGLLSMMALPSFFHFLAKAKRAEAYTHLRALYLGQKAYYAEHGTYTMNLKHLGWSPEGQLQYTYGFSQGSEGVNHSTGALKTPPSALEGTGVTKGGFKIGAVGDIDGDEVADYLVIDHTGAVQVVRDDLIA